MDGIRTATYDCKMEMKNPMDGTTNTINMKSFFLAPSRERVEMSVGSTDDSSVMILDHQEMKGLVLAPKQKLATAMDLSKIKKPAGTSNPFEMVRKLVQEGGDGEDKKIESLGKKEIDGRMLVGFRSRSNMASQTFWADPRTTRLVRIEVEFSQRRRSRRDGQLPLRRGVGPVVVQPRTALRLYRQHHGCGRCPRKRISSTSCV